MGVVGSLVVLCTFVMMLCKLAMVFCTFAVALTLLVEVLLDMFGFALALLELSERFIQSNHFALVLFGTLGMMSMSLDMVGMLFLMMRHTLLVVTKSLGCFE